MMFATLAFGLCAYLTSLGIGDGVAIGVISNGRCVSHLTIGKSGPYKFAGHVTVIQSIDGGATVKVDEETEVVLQRGLPV